MKYRQFAALVLSLFLINRVNLSTIFAQDFECLDCHENLIENSVHEGELECQDCHTDVIDEDHIDSGAKKVTCADCHDEVADILSTDIHHRLNKKIKNAPTCTTCHGTHKIKPPDDFPDRVKTYCTQCHKDGNVVLANPYHTKAVPNQKCYECHDTEDYSPMLKESVHSQLNCADCHNFISHNLDDHPENVDKMHTADCYLCHNDIAVVHRESIHGISLSEGIDEAAECWDCHGSHSIITVDDPKSPVNPENLPLTCGKCHSNVDLIKKFDISVSCPSKMYTSSVHRKVVEEGKNAASCSSCHGVHDIKNRIQPGSKISSFNVPETCGKCHQKETKEYTESIHWTRAKKGVRSAPVCNDCHCEHGINAINSTETPRKEMMQLQEETCLQCHKNPLMAKRYGSESVEGGIEYQDSYHGLAVLRGDEDAAMCVDCHGIHKILPADHPESTVNAKNVLNTCKKCHVDATEVFAKSYSHVTQSRKGRKVEGVVRSIYFWLIITVIGGMVLHNLLIFLFEIRKRRRREKNAISIPRFTKNEVVQHILLLTSFIILAITGFALRYPTSWWAEGLQSLGMTEQARQYIHRGSAVVMITLGIYHMLYLIFTARGRDVLKNLLPGFDDIIQFRENIAYYLYLRKDKPEFDKYDYTEKAEYWALIWGTLIMGLTGLLLWFPTVVGEWAPIWLIKVSEIIHFYEAILASLAILVWHWFFVIFHPKEYPMSFTWIDGKMSLEHYRAHHEKHFKKVVREWLELNAGTRGAKNVSNSTNLFASTLEKNGINPMDIIQSELNRDYKLRAWVDENVRLKESN